MQKLIHFFKYNNAFLIILGFLFLAAGSSFASETVRDTVIGQKIEEIKGVDNTALLVANLGSLKQEIKINDVTEDEEGYNISYSFSTFDIKDNIWQNQTKTQGLRVPKDALKGGKDLGLHVQSELSQIIDSHLAYLKEAQEREQKKGETKIIQVTKYTGLKGLVLNSETKELEGYTPVMEKEERKDPPAPILASEPYTPPATSLVASPASGGLTAAESSLSSSASSDQSSSLSESAASSSSESASSSSESSSVSSEATSSSSESSSSSETASSSSAGV